MHIIVGLVLLGAVGYFWLLGHWFARIIVFLALAAFFDFATVAGGGSGPNTLALVGIVILAWLASSLPIYYWRHRLEELPLTLYH